ncbi:MAG: class I SAM-dependent methyltransferase [Caldilineaceae bacterium]
MADKAKVTLTEEMETLLIPLYSKAVGSRQPNPILEDKKAEEIVASVDYDFGKLKTPTKTVVMMSLRARKLDDDTRAFLARHPNGVVLHLGCGLDSRCLRVDRGQADWIDLDMPQVIDLRRHFYTEDDHYHMIGSSVTDLAWIDSIDADGRPVLVVAEGLLMYLSEVDVKALVLKLKERFPHCEMVADVFSVLTARSVGGHPGIQQTGAHVQWGIDNARDMEQWADGIRLQEEWFFGDAALDQLGLGYRLAFRLSGLIPAARIAHRIVHFTL